MRLLLLCVLLYSPMTNSAPIANNAPTDSKSVQEKESSIHSFKEDIARREQSIDRWNDWYIFFLFVTIVAGVGSLVTTRVAYKKGKYVEGLDSNVRVLQDSIAEERRQAFEIELQQKQLEIESAKGLAAEANQSAGTANDSAGKANAKAAALEKEAAQLKSANLATEVRLTAAHAEIADVNAKRLELERSLAPRTFGANGKIINLDKLKEFAGINIVLRFLPDAESERAASVLIGVLQREDVGWKMSASIPDPTKYVSFFDGVLVTWRPTSPEEMESLPPSSPGNERARMARFREFSKESDRSSRAADELVDFLRANGWEARSMPAGDNELPHNSVGITVGFKPNPYFDPKEIKEMNDKIEKIRQQLLEERHREEKIYPPD